jgi:hypothetical protein
MKLIIALMLILSQNVFALGAHVHGLASLDVATEKNQILIMFKSPGFSVFGFGGKPKTENQKTKVNEIKNNWDKNENLFGLKGSKCQIKSHDFNVKYTGKSHSDVDAELTLECDKDVKGAELEVKIIEKWKKIKEIHLQLLRADGTVGSKKFKDKVYKIKL